MPLRSRFDVSRADAALSPSPEKSGPPDFLLANDLDVRIVLRDRLFEAIKALARYERVSGMKHEPDFTLSF
jgi:hypothetical protein